MNSLMVCLLFTLFKNDTFSGYWMFLEKNLSILTRERGFFEIGKRAYCSQDGSVNKLEAIESIETERKRAAQCPRQMRLCANVHNESCNVRENGHMKTPNTFIVNS